MSFVLVELLPGIEKYLRTTLAKETLSDLADKQRLYFIERLDVLQLPPHLPPKPGTCVLLLPHCAIRYSSVHVTWLNLPLITYTLSLYTICPIQLSCLYCFQLCDYKKPHIVLFGMRLFNKLPNFVFKKRRLRSSCFIMFKKTLVACHPCSIIVEQVYLWFFFR